MKPLAVQFHSAYRWLLFGSSKILSPSMNMNVSTLDFEICISLPHTQKLSSTDLAENSAAEFEDSKFDQKVAFVTAT